MDSTPPPKDPTPGSHPRPEEQPPAPSEGSLPRSGKARGSRALARLLSTVEWLGNLLPHPVSLFALFALGVVVLSGITAAMGLISPDEHQVELLSAGQAPMLFYESTTSTLQNWDADDIPLGISDGVEFDRGRNIVFSPGDMLVLTTDGFFEAVNAADEQFGIQAVEQFIREHHQLPPDEFIQKLYQEVRAHTAGEAQADDLTALVIKRSAEA